MSSVAKKLAMACNAGFFLGIMTAVPSFGQTCTTGATCSSGPSTCGEWSFVYDLNDDLTAEYSLTQEIVHGAVLPPDDLSAQVIQRVLFVPALSYNCQSSSNPPCVPQTPQLYGRSYVWKPNRNPHTVEAVPVPTSPVAFPQDGTQDLFCGGHRFLADGSLLWIGGTDMQRTCTDTPTPCNSEDVVFFGHKGAWRLDTSTATPAWSKAGTGQHTDTMEFERW